MHKCKRLKLEAINQQCAFGKEGAKDEKDEEDEKVSSVDDNRRSSKRVTFHFPHSQLEETHKAVHQGQNQITGLQKSIRRNLEVEDTEKQNSATLSSPYYDAQVEPITDILQESNENTPGPPQPSLPRVRKRTREDQDSDDPQRTPKQPRTTSRWKKRSSREETASTEDHSQSLRTSRQSSKKHNVNPIRPVTPDLGRKSSSVRRKQANPA